MTNGQTYTKNLVNGKTVRFKVQKRIGLAMATAGGHDCGDPACREVKRTVDSGLNGESRKVEAALTTKDTILLRRLNYSQDRLETHQVFESVPHLIANLDANLPEEVLLAQQLTAYNTTGMTAGEIATQAVDEAKKIEPEEI